ncbi:MAG: NADH-quinone oxidoreductase subunit C [Candidatus Kapabacteria bacterium]|nr:NADH-quinone oxidoreductase subunit C [Candidatus Kapabacteria bacterium]
MNEFNNSVISLAQIIAPDFEQKIHNDLLTIIIKSNYLIQLVAELKENDNTKIDMLLDITAIDWYNKKPRFEVVYNLYSNKFKKRLFIKVPVSEYEPEVPSLTSIWESANWYERETYDMYGIKFNNHPNLRRFYMPEDFVDPNTGEPLHPLRKDFPLMGIPDSLPLPPYPERDGEVK